MQHCNIDLDDESTFYLSVSDLRLHFYPLKNILFDNHCKMLPDTDEYNTDEDDNEK